MRWFMQRLSWPGSWATIQTWPALAAIISLQTLENLLHVWGYPAVLLFVMIESTGIPFPGETMLLLASFLAAIDHHLQIPIVIACAALGAIIGDNLGYTVGRQGGRPFVERFGRYVFVKPAHLDLAEEFFKKHGDKTVFFGRFIAILRAWAAFLAGLNRMHWRTFLIYNAAGGILWATIFGLLGYYAGIIFQNNFAKVQSLASTVSLIAGGTIVALALLAFIIFRVRKARRQRAAAAQEAPPTTDEVSPASSANQASERADEASTASSTVQPSALAQAADPVDDAPSISPSGPTPTTPEGSDNAGAYR